MKIISFNGYEFTPKKVTGPIESPENIRAKMIRAALDKCPDDVVVTDYTNSTSIARGNKKIIISVWKFNLSDWPDGRPFNYFYKDGSEAVIVWGLQFYEDSKFLSDINKNATVKCAMGFPFAEENKALFMLGTKAMMYVRDMGNDIKLFFADANPMVEVVANALPSNANIKITKLGLSGTVPVKDYDVRVSYSNGRFTATIPHKYTQTDLVYGAQFRDYSRTVEFATSEDVESFDWDSLWNDLYDNRNGTCTYSGSLGS